MVSPSNDNGVSKALAELSGPNSNGNESLAASALAADLRDPKSRKIAQDFLGNMVFDETLEGGHRHFAARLLGSTEKSDQLFDKALEVLQSGKNLEELIIALELIKYWGDSTHYSAVEKVIEERFRNCSEDSALIYVFEALLRLDAPRAFKFSFRFLDAKLDDSDELMGIAKFSAVPFVAAVKIVSPKDNATLAIIKDLILDSNGKNNHRIIALMALEGLGLTNELVVQQLDRLVSPKSPEELAFFALFAQVVCKYKPNLIFNALCDGSFSEADARSKISKCVLQKILVSRAREEGSDLPLSAWDKQLSDFLWRSHDPEDPEFVVMLLSKSGKIKEVASSAIDNITKLDGGQKFLGFLDFGRERRSHLKEFLEPIVGPLADHERLRAAGILGTILKFRVLTNSPTEPVEVNPSDTLGDVALLDEEKRIIVTLFEAALDKQNTRELRVAAILALSEGVQGRLGEKLPMDWTSLMEIFQRGVGTRACPEDRWSQLLRVYEAELLGGENAPTHADLTAAIGLVRYSEDAISKSS